MRKATKTNQIINIQKINPLIPVHMFENVDTLRPLNVLEHNSSNDNGTPIYQKNEIISIQQYSDNTTENYNKEGNPDVIKFRKLVTNKLLQLDSYDYSGTDKKEVGFVLTLEINDEDIKKYIEIVIYKKIEENELNEEIYGRILVRVPNSKISNSEDDCTFYGINNLIFDSDIDDGLWRLTEKSEWKAKTYLILDFNKNLMVNKGIYLTLDLPFNNNIGWYDPYRKVISGYNITNIIEKDKELLSPEFN